MEYTHAYLSQNRVGSKVRIIYTYNVNISKNYVGLNVNIGKIFFKAHTTWILQIATKNFERNYYYGSQN